MDSSVLNNWLEIVQREVKLAIQRTEFGALSKVKQFLRDPHVQETLADTMVNMFSL